MIDTQQLYELMDIHDIPLIIEELSPKVRGVFYDDLDGLKVIVLNRLIENTSSLFRTVLAEEIGHFFTENSNIIPMIHAPHRARITRSRSEGRALMWASDFLIPTEMLLEHIKLNPLTTPRSIALYFDVTDDLLNSKFYFMSLKNILWKIEKMLYLNLANLPNVYTMRFFE